MGYTIGELVLQARQDDQDAKAELCRQTYNLAYFHATKLIKNQEDALDIVQDSYIKALSSLDRLDNPERFQSWLSRIVINKSKDYLKKKKPVLFVEMQNDNFDSDLDFEEEKTAFQPEAQVDYSETKAIIGEMIDSLPEDQRACVMMFYFEEMSVLEISSMMELSENTIKSKLFYARKKIKAQVLEMEKQQGVKLYSAAPIPFIVWVLRQQAASTRIPPEAAAQLIASATGGATGAAATTTGGTGVAATSSASTGATIGAGIAKTVSVKMIAGIAAGVVAVAGIGVAAYQSSKNPSEIENAPSAAAEALPVAVNADTADIPTEPEESSKTEEPPAAISEPVTMSIYGHEVQFPSGYEGKIHIKEGVDSQGDQYASIYYKPLYDRAQQGEDFTNLRNGEVMYTDLWTRGYYDDHIRYWHSGCVAQGSYTDPIPNQRAISFKPDNILVALHFVDAPSNTASDPDVAEFAKLMEAIKEVCKDMQGKNLPLDQPNYDDYLKGWWEGLGITLQEPLVGRDILDISGDSFIQNFYGFAVDFPKELQDQLVFIDSSIFVSVYYKPIYDRIHLEAGADGVQNRREYDPALLTSIKSSKKKDYDNRVKYWASRQPNGLDLFMANEFPIMINDEKVLLVYISPPENREFLNQGDALYSEWSNSVDLLNSWFSKAFKQAIQNDQQNYDLYLKKYDVSGQFEQELFN